MPWHIGTSSSCPGAKPYAVIKTSDGSVAGCHPTREAANAQLAALYASEKGGGDTANVVGVAGKAMYTTPVSVAW